MRRILSKRQLCDLECIVSGAFAPLKTFLNRHDYASVRKHARLASGQLWPMPIMLDVDQETVDALEKNPQLELRDPQFNLLATMRVDDIFERAPDEGVDVFGNHPTHPAHIYLERETHPFYVSGALDIHQPPIHYDYLDIRKPPTFPADTPVVAFQTRNPMHRAHMELVGAAAASVDGVAWVHPVVGMTKAGDIDMHTRVKCYQEVLRDGTLHTSSGSVPAFLSLLPLAMRMGGPREALWHALIRQNLGATHFIVGRDHAGPGGDIYEPYEARDYVLQHADELDITPMAFDMMTYVKETKTYRPLPKVKDDETPVTLSGTEVRRRLKNHEPIPEWFTPPEVVDILRKVHPPPARKGITLFFTGLSGSGKSTIVQGLLARLHSESFRPVTVLDGDEVRTFLSSELTFSKAHRNVNIERIGYVASRICHAGGIVMTAAIAPYKDAREKARTLVQEAGGDFLEIHVDADVETCEQRDVKGLYTLARQGKLKQFTGIDDPYEIPQHADITIQTAQETVQDSVDKIFTHLKEYGYIA